MQERLFMFKDLNILRKGDYQLFDGEHYDDLIEGIMESVEMTETAVIVKFVERHSYEVRTISLTFDEYDTVFTSTGLSPGSSFILAYQYILNDGTDPDLLLEYIQY